MSNRLSPFTFLCLSAIYNINLFKFDLMWSKMDSEVVDQIINPKSLEAFIKKKLTLEQDFEIPSRD